MKKNVALFLGLMILTGGLLHAAPKPVLDKFYGKITNVDLSSGKLTVHNKKKKITSDFKIQSDVKVVLKKKPVLTSELKEGQNLIVYYDQKNNQKVAKRITIRTPYKRKKKQN